LETKKNGGGVNVKKTNGILIQKTRRQNGKKKKPRVAGVNVDHHRRGKEKEGPRHPKRFVPSPARGGVLAKGDEESDFDHDYRPLRKGRRKKKAC